MPKQLSNVTLIPRNYYAVLHRPTGRRFRVPAPSQHAHADLTIERHVALVALPKASHGSCKRCFQVAELGDGVCQVCWDTEAEAITNPGPKPPKGD